jgi:hypothetical protein
MKKLRIGNGELKRCRRLLMGCVKSIVLFGVDPRMFYGVQEMMD